MKCMSILEENKINELKTKFAELDFKDPDFNKKVENIINETLKGNVDKLGTLAESKTIDEALEEEKEGFDELEKLKDEGVLAELEDKDLEEALNKQAIDGIIDETAERESLEREGFISEEMKKTTIDDLLEEILKQLEETIEEKKKAIDKKIEENEAMRQKVVAREKLRASRTKVSNLHQKTKNYKGTEGKRLNQNVEAAIADFDKQLAQLITETTRDGVEMTDAILDKENEKFEEEKKGLEDMLKGLRESYKKENAKKLKLVLIEKQIDDIAGEITSNMDPEELSKKLEYLTADILAKNDEEYGPEIEKMLKEKTVTIKMEGMFRSKDKEFTLEQIVCTQKINKIREAYMECTGKKEKTEQDEEDIQACKTAFKGCKEVLEIICGDRVNVPPLKTEEEYIKELEKLEKDAFRKQ